MVEFLVQLDSERNFLTRIGTDGVPRGTPYPSFAAAYEYDRADALARQLRDRGYELALVTDRRGRPVSADDLDAVAEALPKFYVVALSEHSYFVRYQKVEGRYQIIHTPSELQATGFAKPDADQVLENLKLLGHVDAHLIVSSFHGEHTASSFSDVWLEPVESKR